MNRNYLNDISGIVGQYSFGGGELTSVEWDEDNSFDISFNNRWTPWSVYLITAGSDVDANTWNRYYAISKYVVKDTPYIDIS